ncbi:hypothetical protein BT69DRAFT_729548 [Atractiella rhizophila]|nr:hypothetical protein BT69DRAFT_729548 [Atractiella rhizophila]
MLGRFHRRSRISRSLSLNSSFSSSLHFISSPFTPSLSNQQHNPQLRMPLCLPVGRSQPTVRSNPS